MTTVQEAGRKGGKARARKLTKAERREACRKAALARWAKHKRAAPGKPQSGSEEP